MGIHLEKNDAKKMNDTSRTFTVLFHGCRNIELVKDVGRIPYYLYKFYGYSSRIVCYRNEEVYGYLNNEAAGLKLEHIKRVKGIPFHIAPVFYLLKNARKISILNLYHLSLESFILGSLYRLLNHKGVLYVKTDLSVESFSRYSAFAEKKKNPLIRIPDFIFRWILQNTAIRMLIGFCSLVSVESTIGLSLLEGRFRSIRKKGIVLPNGAGIEIGNIDADQLFKRKRDIILVVGRIGVPQKNHEMLLDALRTVKPGHWNIMFLGTVEDTFQKKIAEVTEANPDLKGKIVLTGHISDRNLLLKYYSESRVFCLTSNYEGFCIAMVEALCTGNYLVTTKIPSGIEISENGRYGTLIDCGDSGSLANVLQGIIDQEVEIDECSKEAVIHAREKYYWPLIVAKLKKSIDKIYQEEKK